MFRLVVLQAVVTVVVALACALIAGQAAAFSALLGGLACVIPNALFAWRLWLVARPANHQEAAAAEQWTDGEAGQSDGPGAAADIKRAGGEVARHMMAFFVGEFVKLGLTFALLGAIATGYKDLVWVAMIIAIIATLKSYMLAPLWRR